MIDKAKEMSDRENPPSKEDDEDSDVDEDLEIDDMLPGNVFELAQEIVQQSCVLPEDRLLMLEVFGAVPACRNHVQWFAPTFR